MPLSLQLFLSNIKAKDGLARPARFEVVLPIPAYINSFVSNSIFETILNLPNAAVADISNAVNNILGNSPKDEQSKTTNASMSRYLALQCEASELPGKNLLTAEAKVYGPTFKVPYQTQYTETTLTFLCTNDFYERKLFDRWIEAIMPQDTNNMRFPKGESSRYMTNIKIVQYDEFIGQIFAIELIDAYPIGIANQPLSWQDDNFHRLSVNFAYQKYRVIYDSQYDVAAAVTEYFGAKGATMFNNAGQNISNGAAGILNKIF